MENPYVLNLFAGPGGWEVGAARAGLELDILGVDSDADACATATAAGHRRLQADAMHLDWDDHAHARGLIVSPPCPTWSAAGKRSGLRNIDVALDAVAAIGNAAEPAWAPVRDAVAARVDDPRTALFAAGFWAATRLPDLDWVAMEQVTGGLAVFEAVAEVLRHRGWSAQARTIDALSLGLPARRTRAFLLARRDGRAPDVDLSPVEDGPRSFSEVVGWPAGHRVRTRNARRAGGGNLFDADGPSWSLTGSTRTWERDADKVQLTAAQAGMLQGFDADYPWSGSRTKQFLQIADVVLPEVAARVLAAVAGT